jgi:hypothetical protein
MAAVLAVTTVLLLALREIIGLKEGVVNRTNIPKIFMRSI